MTGLFLRAMKPIETPFETGPERYQPPADYVYARDPKLRFDQRRLASVVGIIALGMPIVLGVGGLILGRLRIAISDYYYEPILLGDFFVGCLVAIGALLMTYRGWTPKVAQLATLAGIAALLVAFVPMSGWVSGAEDGGQRIYPVIGYWVHAVSAGVLFAILSFFCLFVFTKIPHDEESGEHIATPAKKRRNLIYRVSGLTIALSAIGIGIGGQFGPDWWWRSYATFWLEALILAAFGISWLTQGRVFGPALKDPRDKRDEALVAAGKS